MRLLIGLLDDMVRDAAASSPGYLVMVLDDAATRIISSVLRMYDIMEEKITSTIFPNHFKRLIVALQLLKSWP